MSGADKRRVILQSKEAMAMDPWSVFQLSELELSTKLFEVFI